MANFTNGKLDAFTKNHLKKWVDSQFTNPKAAMRDMVFFLENDQDDEEEAERLIDKGWPAVYKAMTEESDDYPVADYYDDDDLDQPDMFEEDDDD